MNDNPFPNSDLNEKLHVVPYREQDRLQLGKAFTANNKTNLYVAGLPMGITEA